MALLVFGGLLRLGDRRRGRAGALWQLVFQTLNAFAVALGIAARAFDEQKTTALLEGNVGLVQGARTRRSAKVLRAVAKAQGQVAMHLNLLVAAVGRSVLPGADVDVASKLGLATHLASVGADDENGNAGDVAVSPGGTAADW